MPRKGENIYKRKDGRWEGRFIREYVAGKAKYGYVYAKSYREIREKLRNTKLIVVSNKNTDTTKITLSQIALEWLDNKKSSCKKSTISKYHNILKLYIIPKLGEYEVVNINYNCIAQFANNLITSTGSEEKRLSGKAAKDILSALKNILKYGAARGIEVDISVYGISVKNSPHKIRVFTVEEEKNIIKESYLQGRVGVGVLVCLYCGLRIGEICALTWNDIDLDNKLLHVNKTMQRIQVESHEKKTMIIIDSPKSDCSIRDIPLPKVIIDLLRKEKQTSGYLLTGSPEKYIEPRTMENRFKKLLEKCGISNGNFHALRHTFATRCVELGFDIKSLSEILGHASVNITLNRYVHPSIEIKRSNMDKLNELFAVK